MEGRFDNKTAVPQEIVMERPNTIANVRFISENGDYIETKENNGKITIIRTNIKKNRNIFRSNKKKVKITEFYKNNPLQKNIRYLSDLKEIEKFLNRANEEYQSINTRIGK